MARQDRPNGWPTQVNTNIRITNTTLNKQKQKKNRNEKIPVLSYLNNKKNNNNNYMYISSWYIFWLRGYTCFGCANPAIIHCYIQNQVYVYVHPHLHHYLLRPDLPNKTNHSESEIANKKSEYIPKRDIPSHNYLVITVISTKQNSTFTFHRKKERRQSKKKQVSQTDSFIRKS